MSAEPTSPETTDANLRRIVEDLADRVTNLEDENAELRAENEQLNERVSELEDREKENKRTRASVSRIINGLRDLPEGERLDAESPNLVAEAANTADELYDTMERARQNAGLLDFKEQTPENASVTQKYLRVLGRAEEKAEEFGQNRAYLNYREVASHYGCAYKNDGYRVMEEMAEQVPGVFYVDGRDNPIDTGVTQKIEEKAIRVEWEHPDLRGWVRAHRTEVSE